MHRMLASPILQEFLAGLTRASPNIAAPQIAATGVDLISIGSFTHSAAILNIGLDFKT